MTERFLRPVVRLGILTLAAFVFAGSTAEAVDFPVTGLYRDRRGTIQLPLPPSLFAPAPGIPLSDTLTQTGAAVPGGGPATIGIPAKFIFDPANLEGFLIPVLSVIQLTTSFTHSGPPQADKLSASGGPGSLAYCPGAAANPNCTTVAAGGNQGSVDGIIRYTAGPNKFGGTLSILLKGTGKLVNKGNALPNTTMTQGGGNKAALPFSAKNAALGGGAGNPIAHGAYLSGATGMNTNILGASPATHPLGYMTTPKQLITRGYAIGTAVAQYNQNTGFGFTTGTIYAYRKIPAQIGQGGMEKFTTTGYDNRSAMGVGVIQLVAGSLQRTYPTDGSNPPEGSNLNRAVLNIMFVPEPALVLSSAATLVSLLLLRRGYRISIRKTD